MIVKISTPEDGSNRGFLVILTPCDITENPFVLLGMMMAVPTPPRSLAMMSMA
jgi:hypothetical protein